MSRGVEGVELAWGVEVSSWCRGLVSRCRGQGSGQKARRERLRVVEAARQAGQAIIDTGTHVEILGVQERWWPATIMGIRVDARVIVRRVVHAGSVS